jgi:hypothetical protein
VGFKNTLVTPIFLTVLGMAAATIIPTFVAELIRLWYDNTALDKYPGNEETPHVILCGDNNASRLRVLVGQLFHASRNPNRTAPVVILAEGKPEGALRALLEEHKHSGNVTHVRGTGKRTADLRRAGAAARRARGTGGARGQSGAAHCRHPGARGRADRAVLRARPHRRRAVGALRAVARTEGQPRGAARRAEGSTDGADSGRAAGCGRRYRGGRGLPCFS